MESIQADIQDAKKRLSCSMRITDGKIVCNFNIEDQSNKKTPYVYYEKIFDSITDFNDYAMEFFKDEVPE